MSSSNSNHMQDASTPDEILNPEEMGVLDFLVLTAENWKLIFGGSTFAGLLAFTVGLALPQTFVSTAMLAAPQVQVSGAELVLASLMNSASVVDPVIKQLKLKGEDPIDIAREKLRDNLKIAVGKGDKLVTLTASAESPEQAVALAEAVLNQTYIESKPKEVNLSRIMAQINAAKASEKKAQDATVILAKKLGDAGSGESALGFAELLAASARAQDLIVQLEDKLQGVSAANLVQSPVLPQKSVKPKKMLIALGAFVATFFLLLIYVVSRHLLVNLGDAPTAEKIARMRRAFRFNGR